MKNGSVQRASKRSYMDEATLAAMAQAIANLGSEVGDIKARAEADAVIAAKAAEQVRADLCASIADLATMLSEARVEVALLNAELAGLTARVDPLGALVNAMAAASDGNINLSSEPADNAA